MDLFFAKVTISNDFSSSDHKNSIFAPKVFHQ